MGSLGKGTDAVKVIDPETGEECPRARFDEDGKLLNAEEATGEIVNFAAQGFEGYWKNEEAMRERETRWRSIAGPRSAQSSSRPRPERGEMTELWVLKSLPGS